MAMNESLMPALHSLVPQQARWAIEQGSDLHAIHSEGQTLLHHSLHLMTPLTLSKKKPSSTCYLSLGLPQFNLSVDENTHLHRHLHRPDIAV